jgi:hypothetical protein
MPSRIGQVIFYYGGFSEDTEMPVLDIDIDMRCTELPATADTSATITYTLKSLRKVAIIPTVSPNNPQKMVATRCTVSLFIV